MSISHIKTILWITGGLAIGAFITITFGKWIQGIYERQQAQIDYLHQQAVVHWWAVIPEVIGLVLLVVVGYSLAKKIDKAGKDA